MKFNTGRFNLPDKVSIKPIAQYTIDASYGWTPVTVQFTDTSENEPLVWLWDFGDGTYSDEQNPVHTFYSSGIYTVKLFVINAAGNDTLTKEGLVGVIQSAPLANFSTSVESGNAPLVVEFTDESEYSPTSWLWDFGDGYTSDEQNPAHMYYYPGKYTVTLTATNSVGSDTIVARNYIIVSGNVPVASFECNNTAGSRFNTTVTFTNTSTNQPSEFRWDFGDGTTSVAADPIHTFDGLGVYTVALRAINSVGESYAEQTITITDEIPTCEFTVVLDGFTATVEPTTTGYPCEFDVFWGDNKSSFRTIEASNSEEWNAKSKTFTHTYNEEGTYTIEMIVYNDAGNNTFVGEPFTLSYAAPVASFVTDANEGYAPLMAVQFTDTSTNNPTSWLWEFGDGSISTEQNPVHTYLSYGNNTYTVSLTAINTKGTNKITTTNCIKIKSRDGITIVAAYNSSASEKFYADYVLDNTTSGQKVINEAALVGKTLVFLPGKYICDADIDVVGVDIIGSGINHTIFEFVNTTHLPANMRVSNASGFSLVGNSTLQVRALESKPYYLSKVFATSWDHDHNNFYQTAIPKIEIQVFVDDAQFLIDNVKCYETSNTGFRVYSNSKVVASFVMKDCSAVRCEYDGFDMNGNVSYSYLEITDCEAIDNIWSGFRFATHYVNDSYIKMLHMTRCIASMNGTRNISKSLQQHKCGFYFCDSAKFKTDDIPFAFIKNCVSRDNAYVNYVFQGVHINESPIVVQDCKSIGSEYSIIASYFNDIIVNRFISTDVKTKVLKTTGYVDIDFMNGIVDDQGFTYSDPNAYETGLTYTNAPNNVPDGQIDLSIDTYNDLNISQKSIIEIGE